MTNDTTFATPLEFLFEDDGVVPNHPSIPTRIYKALALPDSADLASLFSQTFRKNKWGHFWKNSVYPFPHYHSNTHEALATFRGTGILRLGGEKGVTIDLEPGTVVLLPPGVCHQRLHGSADFRVLGAYPKGFTPDVLSPGEADLDFARSTVSEVPVPQRNPLTGERWA